MKTKTAIFGSPAQDRFFILLPPTLAMLIAFLMPDENQVYVFLLLLVSIFDSGHVYITLWRTWWNPSIKVKPKSFYLIPAAVFATIFLWNFLEVPYLWSFIVYFTVYHNIRQLYGINKWYQMIEERFDKVTDWFLYGICGLSFLSLHVKPSFNYAYYTGNELFAYPNEGLFFYLQILVTFLFVAYLLYEFSVFLKTKKVFLNRVLFVISAMAIYMAACLWADDDLQLLAPLILTHALHYLALVVLTGTKTNKLLNFGYAKVTGVVLFSLILFGGLEYYAEDNLLDILSHSLMNSILIAGYLVPLLSHFLMDAMIWKRGYPEFKEFLLSS